MATPYKMKNSALYKSAKHGSPMQQNYDNILPEVNVSPKTTPNKKDFVSTVVNKGITVPKKTTQENLTKKQNQVPSEGGRGNTTKGRSKTKKTVEPGRGKTEKKGKTNSKVVDFNKKDSNYKVQFTKSKPESTTNSIKNKAINTYKQLVPQAVQNLNKKILGGGKKVIKNYERGLEHMGFRKLPKK